MRWFVALLPLLLVLPFRPAAADPQPVVVELSYSGYSRGFHVVTMKSVLTMTPNGYRITLAGHTAGVVGFLYHARWQTWAEGEWNGSGVSALHFDNEGVFGGQPRHVAVAFTHGDATIETLQPPDDGEHTSVPPSFEQHVIDSVSVTALVVHEVATQGHCGGQVRVFDGRQVEAVYLHADGPDDLPLTDRSSWRGPTLRCVLDTHVLAGFYRDELSDALRTHADTIWMGNVLPDVPPLPVRMSTVTHHIGRIMLYLTDARLRDPGTLTANRP